MSADLPLPATDTAARAAPQGSKVGAIFDVDNTLLPGATSERLFISHLVRIGHYGPRTILATLATIARYPRLGPMGTLRIHRPYLRGRLIEEIDRLADLVFNRDISPRISAIGKERIRDHQAQGHLVILLSGSTTFLVERLARHLNVDLVIGAAVTTLDGRYTGDLGDLHPYGERKAILAQRLAEQHRLDLKASFAYADHHSDAPLLRLVGHPVCINPTPRLRRLALAQGWPIEAW